MNLKKKMFYIFALVPLLLLLLNNYSYAIQAKWDAYPDWGTVLKISFISLWIDIVITIICIIIKFILNKNNNKSLILVNKVISMAVLTFFCVSIISRVIVELNIYNNAILYFIIASIISILILLFIRNTKILSSKILYIAILIILIGLFITNEQTYPYEYRDNTEYDITMIAA